MSILPQNTTLGKLCMIEVYHYFDGPKLYACENASGQKYVAFWLGDDSEYDEWLYLPVSNTRFEEVRSDSISLYDACIGAEDGWLWRLKIPVGSNSDPEIRMVTPEELSPDDLPDKGVFLGAESVNTGGESQRRSLTMKDNGEGATVAQGEALGTIVSDRETPTFEIVRIKLKAGKDVKPGALVRIRTERNGRSSVLIGRIKSAYEHNPNESADAIAARDTLEMPPRYPREEDSTTIYRQAEADLIEEITKNAEGKEVVTAPETLPNSGAEVYLAEENDVIKVLGLEADPKVGLSIGKTVGGLIVPVVLKRNILQRHLFICGTTGSGKSYAMGVLAEEIIKHNIPMIFIDTQDEYSELVKVLGGKVVEPGKDFTIRISSLTESELLDILPDALKKSTLQPDVVGKAFGELQMESARKQDSGFTLDDVLGRIEEAAGALTYKQGDVKRVTDSTKRRLGVLKKYKIFGGGVTDWTGLMYPCLSINCKKLTSRQLQIIATAVLRELQDLRLRGHIPPYVAVIDEAHLFVPQGEDSPCKQIIREGVRIGRHHGIMMALLTQSPVDIDKGVIRQCNTRLVFALEPDQLDAIRGVKADASEEMLRALPKMPQGTCLLSGTYETIKHTIPVKIRLRRETKEAEGGKAPPIFDEMRGEWKRLLRAN